MKMQQRITFRQAGLVTLFGATAVWWLKYAKEWKSIMDCRLGGMSWPSLLAEFMPADADRMQAGGQNWDGMIAGLNAGKYDVIMDAIVVTPERSKVVAFTQAYAATPASFIAVKGSLLFPR
jgi:octopine/nopaline transport system substrate-binding protein